jgi:hypothetical protein
MGAVGGLVAVAVVGTWAGPAAADPPQPSDYRSDVTRVEPASDAFEVSVVGGDSLMALHVEDGHEVLVEGYWGEPYLRFGRDGTVEENASSPTTDSNEQRYVTDWDPGEGDADDAPPPEWRRVASDGSYAWHDHRAHWMSPDVPDDAEPGQVLLPWVLPLTVDGQPVEVRGELVVEAEPAWWPWLLAVVVAAGGVWLAVRGRPGWRTALVAVALGVAGALALTVAAVEQLSFPAEAGRRLLPVALPAFALACVLATGIATALRRAQVALVVALAAVATVAAWAVLRVDVFTKPVLPTDLSPTLDRAATALALGLAAGAAAVLLARPRATDSGDHDALAHAGQIDQNPPVATDR